MALYGNDAAFTVLLSTIESVEDPELVGGEEGIVYTPVRFSEPEVLTGSLDAELVYFEGGTVDGLQSVTEEGPPAGVVPGARVLVTLLADPGSDTRMLPPAGPLILDSFPLLDDDMVAVTGECWTFDQTPDATQASASVNRLNENNDPEAEEREVEVVPLETMLDALRS